MLKPGDVLDVRALGVRAEIRRTGEETAGALFEFDVVGRARGLLTQAHVHETQVERHEAIAGSMRLVLDGHEHRLGPGDAMEVPAGAAHRQLPAPSRTAGCGCNCAPPVAPAPSCSGSRTCPTRAV